MPKPKFKIPETTAEPIKGPEALGIRVAQALETVDVQSLVARLQEFALADLTRRGQRVVVLTPDQIRAAEMLLRKTVPDLQRTAIEGGDPSKPVTGSMKMELEFVEATPRADGTT